MIVRFCSTLVSNHIYTWDAAVTPIAADHDTSNRAQAVALAMETEKQFVGLFYREERPTMDEASHQISQKAKTFNIQEYMKRYA